jgi:hypothetical protein
VFHNTGRIHVHLNAKAIWTVKIAYLGFRPGG